MWNRIFEFELLEPRRMLSAVLSAAVDAAAGDTPPWVQQTILNAPSAGTVAMDGNTMVVVGDGDTAYLFTKCDSDWIETAKLTNTDGVGFGSVAISGNTVVAGAPFANYSQGAAYVFTEPAAGWSAMTQTARLTPSDGQSRDFFGESVSISGDTIVVGSLRDGPTDLSPFTPGAAYVFTKPGTGWADMTQNAILTASDSVRFDFFGESVSISGNTIVATAEGSKVYLFTEPDSGWTDMTQTAVLTTSDGSYFSGSVSINGNTVVAGAGHDIYGICTTIEYESNGKWITPTPCPGAAYVFTEPDGGWKDMTQTAKLTSSDSTGDFGFSVAISGDTIVVGAQQDAEPVDIGPYPGSAYEFTEGESGWTNMTQTADLTPTGGSTYGFGPFPGNALGFGWSVAISGNTAVVGCYNLGLGMMGSSAAFYLFNSPASQGSDATGATNAAPHWAAPSGPDQPTSPFANGALIGGDANPVPAESAAVLASTQDGGGDLLLLATSVPNAIDLL